MDSNGGDEKASTSHASSEDPDEDPKENTKKDPNETSISDRTQEKRVAYEDRMEDRGYAK
ncbi:hypothetical protein PanWU01x14_055600, partial [Parasponia andersonii]